MIVPLFCCNCWLSVSRYTNVVWLSNWVRCLSLKELCDNFALKSRDLSLNRAVLGPVVPAFCSCSWRGTRSRCAWIEIAVGPPDNSLALHCAWCAHLLRAYVLQSSEHLFAFHVYSARFAIILTPLLSKRKNERLGVILNTVVSSSVRKHTSDAIMYTWGLSADFIYNA